TILLPYYAYFAYGYRPTFQSFKRAYVVFFFYFWFVYFLNPLIGGNYFYLKYRPFFREWPDYLYVPTVLIAVLFCFYFASMIVKLVSKGSEGKQAGFPLLFPLIIRILPLPL